MVPLLLAAAALAFVVGVPLGLWSRSLTLGFGQPAIPAKRAGHHEPVPAAGGFAVIAAMTISSASLFLVLEVSDLDFSSWPDLAIAVAALRHAWVQIGALLSVALLLLIVGNVVDRFELSPLTKLTAEAVAVLPILTLFEVRLLPQWLGPIGSVLATVLWFLVLINAIHLLDGHDGVAASVALICGGVLAVAAVLAEQLVPALLLAVTGGALAAILPFNLPPARLFLGNGGSLLIGYLLAAASVLVTYHRDPASPSETPWYGVLTPIVVFAVPLYDLGIVILLRLRQERRPWGADRQHLHHRLSRRGFGPRAVLLVICACTLATAMGGLMLAQLAAWQALLVAAQTAMILLVILLLEWTPAARMAFRNARIKSLTTRLRLVLAGGATGGHVYPALAMLEALRASGREVRALYLGESRGLERDIVRRANVAHHPIPSAPLAGRNGARRVWAMAVIAAGTLVATVRLLWFRPHLVLLTGGFAAAPVVLAAYLLRPLTGLRIAIFEPNAVPGALNAAVSLVADLVLLGRAETAGLLACRHHQVVGYPVRAAYRQQETDREALAAPFGISTDGPIVLFLGGSHGSETVNDSVAESLGRYAAVEGLTVLHVVGPDREALAQMRGRLGSPFRQYFDGEELRIGRSSGRLFYLGLPYCHRLDALQALADLVVSRAGAGAIAEIAVLGKASILIPDRNVPGDHQEANARTVSARGGAEVLPEQMDSATGRFLVPAGDLADRVLALLADPPRRKALGATARTIEGGDFVEKFAAAVEQLLTDELPGSKLRGSARSSRRALRLAIAMLRRGSQSG